MLGITHLQNHLSNKPPICVGLDPRIDLIPDSCKQKNDTETIRTFCREVIETISPLVPIIKFQIAYFEALGIEGFKILSTMTKLAHKKGMYVIMDAKRGDIGTTCEAYAKAYFDQKSDFYSDALTINTYFGSDAINAFAPYFTEGKMVFTMIKNSNPSSKEFQDKDMNGMPAYQTMGNLVETWGENFQDTSTYSCIGGVIGATSPDIGKALRSTLAHTFFLVPGFGAQGGNIEDFHLYQDQYNNGAIFTASRSIIYAYQNTAKKTDWRTAIKDQVHHITLQIQQ
jgi:orotidine-5'-phosphate decarboxylase